MAKNHMSNEEFLTEVSKLFESRRKSEHGSIYLTQKRLTFSLGSHASTPTKVPDDPLWDLHPEKPLPIIVRATNGKGKKDRSEKIKLSTIVQPDSLEDFYSRYAEVCKSGMSALKKRDRSKKKKERAKKKKAGAETEKKT